MKSEERHDLETNELAKLITGSGDKFGPYVSYVVYGLLAIAAIWAIVRLTTGSMTAKQLQAWDSYTVATLPGKFDANSLEAAAKRHAGEPIGELAQIAWADSQLAQGCQNYFSDKSRAMEQLDAAQEAYDKLASSADDKNLRGRAQLGIAKSLEAKGKVAEAIEAYGKVSGAFSAMAEARATSLKELDAQRYADWLASAEGARRATNFGSATRPDFSADPLALPGGDPATGGAQAGEDFLQLLERYNAEAPPADPQPDRYEEGDTATTPAETAGEGAEDSPEEPATAADSTAEVAADESVADTPSQESATEGSTTEESLSDESSSQP